MREKIGNSTWTAPFRSGSRVRVTAQLIDAMTGGHIWAERFDRELTDIFDVQDDVTARIVSALSVNRNSGERRRIATARTASLDAYDSTIVSSTSDATRSSSTPSPRVIPKPDGGRWPLAGETLAQNT